MEILTASLSSGPTLDETMTFFIYLMLLTSKKSQIMKIEKVFVKVFLHTSQCFHYIYNAPQRNGKALLK